jgi:hypothetical protein
MFACPVLSGSGGTAIARDFNNGVADSSALKQEYVPSRRWSRDSTGPNDSNNQIPGSPGNLYRRKEIENGELNNSNMYFGKRKDTLIVPQSNSSNSMTSPNNMSTSGTSSVSDMNQVDQLQLQQSMDKKSQLEETMSNVMKKQQDTQQSIINNLK